MKKHGFFIYPSDFARSKIQHLRRGVPLCSRSNLFFLKNFIFFPYPRLILPILYPANPLFFFPYPLIRAANRGSG